MPRYKVIDGPTYIGDSMRQPGETVEYAGWPGSTLEPVKDDAVAQRVKAFYVDVRAKGKKFPRVPDLSKFADPPPAPEKPAGKSKPVKDE